MASKKKPSKKITINTVHALEQAKRFMDEVFTNYTQQGKGVFDFTLKPYQEAKTHLQLKTIRKLCNDLSATDQNEWAGHTSDWWYQYYKLRAYVPLVERKALDDNDQELIDLIQLSRDTIRANQFAALFQHDPVKILSEYNKHLAANKNKEMLLSELASEFIAQSKQKDLGTDSGKTVIDLIAENPCFSYSQASKTDLNGVIKFILENAATKGIVLTIEKQEGE